MSDTTLFLNGLAKKNGAVRGKDARLLKVRETLSPLRCGVTKPSTVHRTRIGDKKKKLKVENEEPRVVGPPDTSIHIREEGPTVQQCGDSNVAEMGKWSFCNGTEVWRGS